MRKQFTFITILMLICASISFGQTGIIGPHTKSPGDTVKVPLTVSGWTNVSAITLNIRWTKDVLTFTGITGSAVSGYVVGSNDSTVFFTWTNTSMATINGVLLNLNFVYNGVTASPLHFLTSCSVSTGISPPVPLFVTWTDGSVNPKLNNSQTATLGNPTALTGGLVTVPLMYAGFGAFGSNVGSITQKIHFDASKLSFVNITTTGNLNGAFAYASNGELTIFWTNTAGKNIDFPANQLNINFIYNGNTATNVNFYSGCLISTNLGANIPVSYFNGSVSPGAAVGTAVLGSLINVLQGQDYEVPLNLTFPTGISSITLNIIYDHPRLSFIGMTSPAQPGILVNTHGDTISIAYTNYSAPSVNGTFLKLKFKYNGVGVANVMFGPGCLFTNNLFAIVQTGYTNATLTPDPFEKCDLGSVSGTPGNTVLVPITFTNLPANIGAVTIFVNFDLNKLLYIDALNNIHNATVWSPSAGHVAISWAAITPTDINGLFLNLRFLYLGGGATPVTFGDGCEVANISANIVPLEWNNGGVNVSFEVSGLLRYDNTPNTLLPLVGFTVYLKTDPGGSVVDSATTDGTGYFELMAPNGNYKLSASPAPSSIWFGDLDCAVAIFDYVLSGGPLPYETPLRLLAADVALSGVIDLDDVVAEFNRVLAGTPIPEFTAPDWLFDNPSITVSGADLPNQDFFGLCSGDVLGNNPTP
jgi:hypothetical protein